MKGLGSGALNYIIFLFNIYLTYAEKYNGPVYRSSYWRYRNASGTLYGLEYYMGTKLYSRNPAKGLYNITV